MKRPILSGNALLFVALSAGIVILDQVSKKLVAAAVMYGNSLPLIPGFISLTPINNTGAAFGMLQGYGNLLAWLSVIVLGIILYSLPELLSENRSTVAAAFLAAGVLGNLIDRIFLGHVVDFLDVRYFSAFNVADSALSLGTFLLVLHYALKKDPESARKKK